MVELGHALANVVTLPTLISLLIGIVLGLLGGALPGITITLTMVLLLPFTFYLSPEASIALLLGTYVAGFTGGAFSAITLNMPGTPSAAGTALDGYPLAQKGQADLALFLAIIGSLFGGVLGFLVLVSFTPVVASFAIRFGPPEVAMLILSALTLVIVFSSGNLLKGLLSAGIGAALALVGLDPVTGVPRYTLGQLELQDGIPFLIALIGLFAFPQLVQALGGRKDVFVKPMPFRVRQLLQRALSWSMVRVAAVGALIGTMVGAIPGTGGPIAVFLAYGAIRRVLPRERRTLLGKGAPEGVVACEASNSAVSPGALMPLITLGIPGDPVTAVLLGALIIHGLAPGPLFFQQNTTFVYEIFAVVALAILLTSLVALLGARLLLLALNLPRPYLASLISTLVLLGTYSIRNNFFDVGLMLLFGVLGFVFQRFNFPVVPLLLAIILFRPLEQNLRMALTLSGGDLGIFLNRPIALLFLLVATAALFASLRGEYLRALQRKRGFS